MYLTDSFQNEEFFMLKELYFPALIAPCALIFTFAFSLVLYHVGKVREEKEREK
jgi:hypothetical protein